jgi:hypothetical protein
MRYLITEHEGSVRLSWGANVRLWAAARACRIAWRLRVGADVAASQHRLLDPTRYGIPGDPFEARLGFTLAGRLFAVACLVDAAALIPIRPTAIGLTWPRGGDEPDQELWGMPE